MEENIAMWIVKKMIKYTVPVMMSIGLVWGVITWDFNRGINLYITLFTKTFTPIVNYAVEKKIEHETEKMEKVSEKFVEHYKKQE